MVSMEKDLSQLPGILEALRIQGATVRLAEFFRQAWPVLEPSTPLVWGWHIDAICEHLEAVSRGDIQNLIIGVPPGSTKSTLVAVCWPAWEWIERPSLKSIFFSHTQDFSTRDSVACRRLIESEWYQERWGDRFTLTTDQNIKTHYVNDRLGVRLALSVGTNVTGWRGDRLVIDDANDAEKVRSDIQRKAVLRWADHAWYNRVNDARVRVGSRRVIIGQRLHVEDLIGYMLAKGNWEHLLIPEEYDPKRARVTSIGWRDPRQEEGDWLRPQRFAEKEKAEALGTMGSVGYAAQHQQSPVPDEGAMFKFAWFEGKIIDRLPGTVSYSRIRYWDKAATEKEGSAYSAGVKISRANGRFTVEHVKRGRWSAFERNQVMKQTAQADEKGTVVWMEQEPGSGGKESAQYSVKDLAGFDVRAEPVTGDKETRARPFAAQCEAGNVYLLRGEWNQAFLDELCIFPMGKFKDQVDGASGAFNKLTERGAATSRPVVLSPGPRF